MKTGASLRNRLLLPHIRLLGWLGCLLLTLGCSQTAWAQSLAADDVLSVTVLSYPELSVDAVTVSPAGTINLPVAGQIRVTGKTPLQLSREIAARLNKRVVNPEVTVSLRIAGGRRVFVLGGVVKPGVYEIKPGWRISEVLAAAGGVGGRLDETKATLARPGLPPLPVSLKTAVGDPASGENHRVRAGDVLVVTTLEPKYVTLIGDVARPDRYPLRRARRLLDIITSGGGLRQPASRTRVAVLRRGKRIELNIEEAMQSRGPAINGNVDTGANIELLPDDLVIVDAVAPLSITVNGLVRNPGNYALPEGSGVLQAIAQAGGQVTPLEKAVVSVRRGQQVLPIDVARATLDPAFDIRLHTNDLVQLSEPQIIRVQVTGQVRTPGELRLPPQSTVLEAISRAGGLAITPETSRISIVRGYNGREVSLSVDPIALTEGSDLRQNTRLQEGDLVSITNIRSEVVVVSGQVARPGAYDLKAGESIPELLARAGGPTPLASLRRVQVQRDGTTRSIDALGTLRSGAARVDFPLQQGDFVVVPENLARVLVTQEVNRPGYVAIPEDRTLTVGEAISLAGGPKDRAKLNEAILFRRVEGGVKSRIVRLDKAVDGELGLNQTLVNGDILYLPIGRPSKSSAVVGSALSTLGTLRFLGAF